MGTLTRYLLACSTAPQLSVLPYTSCREVPSSSIRGVMDYFEFFRDFSLPFQGHARVETQLRLQSLLFRILTVTSSHPSVQLHTV